MDLNPNEGETGDLGEELITVKGEAKMLVGKQDNTEFPNSTLTGLKSKQAQLFTSSLSQSTTQFKCK